MPKTPASISVRFLGGAMLAAALPGHAADFKFAGGDLAGSWRVRAVAGTGVRTSDRSRHLVGKGFRSDGKPKGGDGADTADDGNLNYGKGDVYGTLFKLVGGIDLTYRNLGLALSARTWYDASLKHADVPQGNVPSGFAGGRPLSDRGLSRSNAFSGFMWLDAYAYGRIALGEGADLDLRVGRQTVKWGEGLFFQGLNQINPLDYTTLHRPGTDPASEAQLPVEMLWGKLGFAGGFSVEGFYQWRWRPAELDPCGTFFASTDLGLDRGCAGIESNAYYPLNAYSPGAGPWLSDGYMNSVGAILPRNRDRLARNGGQWGLALRYHADAIATDFGAYYLRIHSRLPYLDATTIDPAIQDQGLVPRLLAAGVPLTDAQLSARLSGITDYWAYPEGIRIVGLSAASKWRGWRFGAELSYSKDQPVQINTADMFAALTRNGGPIGGRMAALAPGGVLRGYDRFDKTQFLFNASRSFRGVLGADAASAAGELAWSHANLPPLGQARYGRGFAWGFSPQWSDGSCSPVQNPQGCLSRGYFSRQAWGYRLRGQLDYTLAAGWVLSPSLSFGQDLHGYSVDGQLVQGRKQYALALAAKYRRIYFASLSFTNYVDNAPYDLLKDHDFLSFALGANF